MFLLLASLINSHRVYCTYSASAPFSLRANKLHNLYGVTLSAFHQLIEQLSLLNAECIEAFISDNLKLMEESWFRFTRVTFDKSFQSYFERSRSQVA